ncbi:hypothetical protein R6Z07F_000439 [Ovis aries]
MKRERKLWKIETFSLIWKTWLLYHSKGSVSDDLDLIAGRNINDLRYADDTSLMAESEEELKSLLMKVKEDEGHIHINCPYSEAFLEATCQNIWSLCCCCCFQHGTISTLTLTSKRPINVDGTQLLPTLCDPMDCTPPVSPSVGLPRQEYWTELPFPSPGEIPDPGTEPRSPALQADALPLSHLGSLYIYTTYV